MPALIHYFMQINHGTMTLRGNAQASAAVLLLDLPNFVQSPAHPIPGAGVTGTVTLTAPPHVVNFNRNDIIDYADGNHNNDLSFNVTSVVGPAKYNVTVR
jgi:hypothetical protein